MKEEKVFLISLVVRDENGKSHKLEKQETFELESGRSAKKVVSFWIGNKEHKFSVRIDKVKKGELFGDILGSHGIGQGKFMPEQKPVKIISSEIKIKDNQWKTKGKIFVGSLIVLIVIGGIITLILWKTKKKVKKSDKKK